MKKNKKKLSKSKQDRVSPNRLISPEDALRFLEDIRTMAGEVDEPTVAISLRVPNNILRAIKLKAKSDNKKYQSLIIEFLRKALRQNY